MGAFDSILDSTQESNSPFSSILDKPEPPTRPNPLTRAVMAQAASDPSILYDPDHPNASMTPPAEGAIAPNTEGPFARLVSDVKDFFMPPQSGQMPQTAGQILTGIPTAIGRGYEAAKEAAGLKKVLEAPLAKPLTYLPEKAGQTLEQADSTLWKTLGRGMASAGNVADVAATPENLVLAAGLGTAPGLVRKMSAVGFGVPMVRHAVVSGQGALASLSEGDIPGAVGQGIEALGTGAMGVGALAHGAERAPVETGGAAYLETGPSAMEAKALARTQALKEAQRLQAEVAGEREGTRAAIMTAAAEGLPKITPTPLPVPAESTGTPIEPEIVPRGEQEPILLARQSAEIKSKGQAIDALNSGVRLHPAIMEKFFGDLPENAGYVDTGDGKGLRPAEQTPDGRIIQRLPSADEDTTALASGMLKDHYGADDYQTIANKFMEENGTGKIVVSKKDGVVPETRAVKGGNWRVLVPPDTDPVEFFHELAMHVKTRDGQTLLGDLLPHDDSTNQQLADLIVEKGVPTFKTMEEGQPSYSGTQQPTKNYIQPPNIPSETAQNPGVIATLKGMADRGLTKAVSVATKSPAGTLAGVAKAIPPVIADVRSLISSKTYGRTMTYIAKRAINNLYDDETAWEKFKTAKLVDNLRAKAAEYNGYANAIRGMSPEELLDRNGQIPDLIGLLKDEIQGTKRFPDETFATEAQSLFDKGRAPELKSFLSDVYRKAAAAVPKETDPEIFDVNSFMADPRFLDANAIFNKYHGNLFEDAFNTLHPYEKARAPRTRGEYGYFPAIATGEAGEPVRSGPPSNIGPYVAGQRPYYRSGLHDVYDTSDDALTRSAANAQAAMMKYRIIDRLQREGWIQTLSRGANPVIDHPDGTKWINVNGKEFPASQAVQIVTQAGGGRSAVMPKFLHDALTPILDPRFGGSPENILGRVGRIITRIQLAGIGDFVSHSVNEAAAITGAIPMLKGGILANLPGTKLANAVFQVVRGMADKDFWDDPGNVQIALDMAKNGELPSRFLAADAHSGLSRFLWGEHGSDIVGRVMLRKAAMELNPSATPQQLFEYTKRMGTYIPELQSAVGHWSTRTGIGPFYVAGSQMLKNSIDAWTSLGKMPFDSQIGPDAIKAKAINQLNAGAIGAITMWTGAYVAATGKPPWEDPDSKLFDVPVPAEWADTMVGHALWRYTEKRGERHYINLAYLINPLLARGSKILPVEGTYSTLMRGGNLGQAVSRDAANAMTQVIHPVAGPAVHAVTAMAGFSPGIADWTDQRGNLMPQFYRTGAKASSNPVKFVGRALGGALEGLNPMSQGAYENAWGRYAGDRTGTEKLLAVMFHLIPVVNNIFQSANPALERKYTLQQRKAIEKNELSEASH